MARAGGDDKSYAAATALKAARSSKASARCRFIREAALAFEPAPARKEAAVPAWRAVLDRTPLDGQAFNQARDLMRALHKEESAPGPLVELYTH